MHLADAFI